jgi:hypothetical protein
MGKPDDERIAPSDGAPDETEYLPGMWIELQGGEEDATIRPSQVLPRSPSRPQERLAGGSNS